MPEITRVDIENWIRHLATGEFHYTKVMGLSRVLSPEEDNKLRKIMYDLTHAKDPCVESIGRHDGYYRPIDEVPEPEDWQGVDATVDFPVVLPFNLRKYVWIDAGTNIVVAGSKDSGKTGFIMRTVAMNMNEINTVFLCNLEGGKTQLKRRFDAMDIYVPNPAPFKVYHVIDNFHEV